MTAVPRVFVIAPEKALARRLATAVMASGASADTFARPDELRGARPDLVVARLATSELATVARRAGPAPIIAVLDAPSLDNTVAALKQPGVAAAVVAGETGTAALTAAAARFLTGQVFGLSRVVPSGVLVRSLGVGDYEEKSASIAAISQFAEGMGVRRKYRDTIEQALDELLMNALYDAPVDSSGRQTVATLPARQRVSMQMARKVAVEYACDGDRFYLAVRDPYGALEAQTVVRYLDKCLHADDQIDRKEGGAGLGLYLVANSASQVSWAIVPGEATEVIAVFDLEAPRPQLTSLALYEPRAHTRIVAPAPPRPAPASGAASASRSLLVPVLTTAIAVVLALIGVVAWARFAL